MSKKGFTLVELLAVIVILAIIAVIATPIILGVIEKAKIGAAEQSALGYIDAVEKQIAIDLLNANENSLTSTGIFNVPLVNVSVKGTKPTKGWIELEKGNVKNYSILVGEYVVTKGEKTVKNGKIKSKPLICEKVNISIENSYSLGDEYSCNPGDGKKYTFYLLEDGDNNSTSSTKIGSISLIMNKNIDDNAIAWSADGINDNGPVTALSYLLEKTNKWTDVDVSLPTYNQILNINGTIANLPEWIYTNVSPYGYWTDTIYPKSENYQNYAWQISTNHLFGDDVKRDEKNGVRPVITIPKSSIKG